MMTKREKIVVSAYTGVLMCNFDDLHKYIEELFGRPVWTHEIANEKVQAEIKEKSKVEFLKICGGDDNRKEKPIYTHCDAELNAKVAELMDDYAKLVEKAKSFGFDIRLYDTSNTLELYYNDDYPDTLLVDKHLSSIEREEGQ